MPWDTDKLRQALQENDEKAGAALLGKLPKWERPRPGVTQAVMVPKRPKAKKEAG